MGFHAYAMKTHLISAYSYYPKYNLSQENKEYITQTKPMKTGVQNKTQVSFTGMRPVDFLIRKFGVDPLYHFCKYSKEEYLRLSLSEIQNLRKRSADVINSSTSDSIRAIDDIHSIIPTTLKDTFDKFFGEGKYVVITIGRSLSTIGKALGCKIGEENVINLPMSWSRRFLPETTRVSDHFSVYNNICHKEGLDKFLEYLEKLGLGKEQAKQSGKSYVLMDYCCSGDSLKGAEFLFKSDYVWGPSAKVYAVDVLSALEKYDIPMFDSVQMDPIALISKTLCASHLKLYSEVGRVLTLGETESSVKRIRFSDKLLHKDEELIRFRMLDSALRPQTFPTPKLKMSEGEFQLSGQRVEPWHNYITQAESDIRNDIQRVNYQIMKLDASDNYGTKIRRELESLYNDLTDYYNTYKRNPYALISYYGSRNKIQTKLLDVESSLQGKGIFAQ